jgi:hypothetical protein
MMSEERELLVRCRVAINIRYDQVMLIRLHHEIETLLGEVEELLEQPEQEPVAYVYAYDYLDSLYYATDKDVADYPRISRDGKPLYSSPPTREPLSDEEMRAIWKEGIRGEIPFVEIGRAIEKAHGIGGVEWQ